MDNVEYSTSRFATSRPSRYADEQDASRLYVRVGSYPNTIPVLLTHQTMLSRWHVVAERYVLLRALVCNRTQILVTSVFVWQFV